MSLLAREDPFSSLFGLKRGIPGSERERASRFAQAHSLIEMLVGAAGLPAGLTLVRGEPGAGKTVLAAALYGELADSGRLVACVDCEDGGLQRIVIAERPSATVLNAELGKGVELAQALTGQAQPVAIVLDSLAAAAGSKRMLDITRAARALQSIGRDSGIPLIATCATKSPAEPGWPQLTLDVGMTASGPDYHEFTVVVGAGHRRSGAHAVVVLNTDSLRLTAGCWSRA